MKQETFRRTLLLGLGVLFCEVSIHATTTNSQEMYALLTDSTLVFYYGEKPEGAWSVGVENAFPDYYWSNQGDYSVVIFDKSVSQAHPEYCRGWFSSATNLKSIIGIENLNTSAVKSMYSMFYGCSNLDSIDVSNFDTSNVRTMYRMFDGCCNLKKLNVGNFDTSNVVTMEAMFCGCSSLSELDLSQFDTRSCKSIRYLLAGCSGLTHIDLKSFETNYVEDMSGLFSGCTGMKQIDISNFNTYNVNDVSYMFDMCTALKHIDFGHVKFHNVKNMSYMFSRCMELETVDILDFDTSNATDMHNMFDRCYSLTQLDLTNFKTENVNDFSEMFKLCENLTTIFCNDAWKSRKSTDMFDGCFKLKGAINYDWNCRDVGYANPENGYFTRKTGETVGFDKTLSSQEKKSIIYSLSGLRTKYNSKEILIVDGKKLVTTNR